MPAVVYPYKRLRTLQVPVITLAVQYANNWFPLEAYIDSGATYSVFTTQVASMMGLDYRSDERKYVQVGDGSFILVYLHELEVQIGRHRLMAPLGFSEQLGLRFNLLGRAGIFNHFKVCFDEKQFLVTLSPYQEG